jgi:hypothetical protein
MKQLKRLGIGLGLILIGMNGTVQAQTIYNSIWSTNTSKAQIKAYDMNRRQLEPPRPAKEPPGHTDLPRDNNPKRHRSILDKPSG